MIIRRFFLACYAIYFSFSGIEGKENQTIITEIKSSSKLQSDEIKPINRKILLVGRSGAGKSTAINMIANYLKNIKNPEKKVIAKPIRSQEGVIILPDGFAAGEVTVDYLDEDDNIITDALWGQVEYELDELGGMTNSCTSFPHSVVIRCGPHTVHLIDTPGLLDTGGFKEDEENREEIIKYLGTIREIDGVLFVVPDSDLDRNNAANKILYAELRGMMPQEITASYGILTTHSASFIRESVKLRKEIASKEKNEDRIQNLSNRITEIKKSRQNKWQETFGHKVKHIFFLDADLKSDKTEKDSWQANMLEIHRMFDWLDHAPENQKIRGKRFVELQELKADYGREINKAISTIVAKEQMQKDLEHFSERIDSFLKTVKENKDYVKILNESTKVENFKPHHYTRCNVCKMFCHYPRCYLEKLEDGSNHFRQCLAFGGDENCRVCGHPYNKHYHTNVETEIQELPKLVTDHGKKALHDKAHRAIEQIRAQQVKYREQLKLNEEFIHEKITLLKAMMKRMRDHALEPDVVKIALLKIEFERELVANSKAYTTEEKDRKLQELNDIWGNLSKAVELERQL